VKLAQREPVGAGDPWCASHAEGLNGLDEDLQGGQDLSVPGLVGLDLGVELGPGLA
jgi:hypothetical protein